MSLFWKPLAPQPKKTKKTSCKFQVNASYTENDVCLNDCCGIKSCEPQEVINEITLSVGKQA